MARIAAPMCEHRPGYHLPSLGPAAPLRMVRLYRRKPGGGGWLPVGWYCATCGSVTTTVGGDPLMDGWREATEPQEDRA